MFRSTLLIAIVLLQLVWTIRATAQSGSFDASFQSDPGADQRVTSILVLPDDRIMIGGRFTAYNGVPVNRLARLLPNGELDNSFQIGTGFDDDDDQVEVITATTQGQFYIGGRFVAYDGTPRKNILRINGNGVLDISFDPGTGPPSVVRAIAMHMNGSVLVGGAFGSYDGTPASGLCRVLPDGSYDPGFPTSFNSQAVVLSIHVGAGFNTYVGGSFGSFGGQLVNNLAKLLPDGELDGAFAQDNTCNGSVRKIRPIGNNEYLIMGSFTEYDGIAANGMARINNIGGLVQSFNVGSGPDEPIEDAAVQSDGKIIVVGNFSTFNGQPAPGIVRLMPDGSVDTAFNPGGGSSSNILACTIQPDGKVLIGGSFTEYDGNDAGRVARVLNDVGTGTPETGVVQTFTIQPNPAAQDCYIRATALPAPVLVRIMDVQGRTVQILRTAQHIDISGLSAGVYGVQIFHETYPEFHRLVVE